MINNSVRILSFICALVLLVLDSMTANIISIIIIGALFVYYVTKTPINRVKNTTAPEDIFTDEFLDELGFIVVHRKNSDYKPYSEYGKAVKGNGRMFIYWCVEGHSVTYHGEKLEPNVSFELRTDGDTRTLFCGYAFNQDDVRKIFKLTA